MIQKAQNKAIGETIERMRKEGVRWVDLHFLDVPGYLQHMTIPAHDIDEGSFAEGIGKLDGSSIKGFKAIEESDMMLVPDPSTFAIIPWYTGEHKTARMIANIGEAFGGGQFTRDPRHIAQRAEERLLEEGYDFSLWGPEIEFFVFDSVKFDALTPYKGQGYTIESREAVWLSTGKNFPIRFKEGYYPAPPVDTLQEYRNEVALVLERDFGVFVDAHHHEVATAGQLEIDMRAADLTRMADNAVTYKYVAKNIAYQRSMIATFMPKPIFGDNASGMHTHQSLWSEKQNIFYDEDDGYAQISQVARYYIGGLMEHSRALSAIVAPTTNSYKRLVPGYEAPVYITWSKRNRSANVRVPIYEKNNPGRKRVEYRPPDPAANPYLCFAAQVAAGLDGVRRKIDPGDPVDENIYHLTPERRRALGIGEFPGSLKEAIDELKSDTGFLKTIFPDDLLETYVDMKEEEYKANEIRPTPYEFFLYFDVG